jgi:hypothetical protein
VSICLMRALRAAAWVSRRSVASASVAGSCSARSLARSGPKMRVAKKIPAALSRLVSGTVRGWSGWAVICLGLAGSWGAPVVGELGVPAVGAAGHPPFAVPAADPGPVDVGPQRGRGGCWARRRPGWWRVRRRCSALRPRWRGPRWRGGRARVTTTTGPAGRGRGGRCGCGAGRRPCARCTWGCGAARARLGGPPGRAARGRAGHGASVEAGCDGGHAQLVHDPPGEDLGDYGARAGSRMSRDLVRPCAALNATGCSIRWAAYP